MQSKTLAVRPLNVHLRPKSKAEKGFHSRSVMPQPEARVPGVPATPAHDLKFFGGKTIADLQYQNYFVGGAPAWNPADVQAINKSLEAAMADRNLNNVMVQYFPAGKITSTYLGAKVLAGPKPSTVSQGDVEALVRRLNRAGKLKNLDLQSTVLCFFLPSGTILNTDTEPTAGLMSAQFEGDSVNPISPHDEEDSTEGLGGYHGSIHVGRAATRKTIYYTIAVFSELLPDGTENGIVVFDKPWKNVVATMYHELNEVRTDADVEDAIRAGDDPQAVRFLGWVSNQGEECGDFPVVEAHPITKVFKEVPLSAGSSTVPVQLQYSNAVHGPEGPIAKPHPAPAVPV